MEDLSVDLYELEELFKTVKPSCFILVSVLGLVPKMNEITDLCKKYDVILIEDCCESLGSEYSFYKPNDHNIPKCFHKKLGSFGHMSVFSTYYGHHISTIERSVLSAQIMKNCINSYS